VKRTSNQGAQVVSALGHAVGGGKKVRVVVGRTVSRTREHESADLGVKVASLTRMTLVGIDQGPLSVGYEKITSAVQGLHPAWVGLSSKSTSS
jgi:hypothetical protein